MEKIKQKKISRHDEYRIADLVDEALKELIIVAKHWDGKYIELGQVIDVKKIMELWEALTKKSKTADMYFPDMSRPVQFMDGQRSDIFRMIVYDGRKHNKKDR